MAELETRELEYFVAVAEELHFGRAAASLAIAQPALSKAVRRLESRVGVKLLERSSRHVALTSVGQALLHHGRHALNAVGAAQAGTYHRDLAALAGPAHAPRPRLPARLPYWLWQKLLVMRLSASLLVCLGLGNRQSRPWIVSDELWSLVEPLLPKPGPEKAAGRPRVPDRQALCGILFVLHTGIQWEYLPQELGFGPRMTCWRRLAAWNEAGVRDQLHQLLLNELRSKNQLDRTGGDRLLPRTGRPTGPKAGPARSTAHVRAANTTSSSTDRASRSRYR